MLKTPASATPAEKAFTIVELLIVIVVIAILAAIGIVAYNGVQSRARDSAVQADLRNAFMKLQEFGVLDGAPPNPADTRSPNAAVHEPARAKVNEAFRLSPSAHETRVLNVLYCWSDDGFAIVSRSAGASRNGFFYSTAKGAGSVELDGFGGYANANLCPHAGIPTTGSGYTHMWMYVGTLHETDEEWLSWFTGMNG